MKILYLILIPLQVLTGNLNQLINNFKAKSGNEGINISVSIRNTKGGQEIYQYNAASNLPPASTLKLLTTATAFKYLGGDFQFETIVYANGPIKNGILQGDLVIEGVGDPSFGSPKFKSDPLTQISNLLTQNKIRHIEGSIRIANNDQVNFPLAWLITDIGNYYGAFPNNFNFHENYYTVYFEGGQKIGDPVKISNISPYDPSWRIRNEVKTGEAGSGDQVNILNLPFSNDIQLVGTVPLNAKKFAVKGAIPSVNYIFTDSLNTYLKQKGVQIDDKIFSDQLLRTELGTIESPTVFDISKETNYRSVNFFADGLANYMSHAEADNFDEFVKLFWKEEGLQLQSYNIYDGSGLAPQNSFSCSSMTSLLYKMSDDHDFIASIPTVGRDGTVAYMGKNTGGRIKAKSGSISGTRNYSGYFTAHNGEQYVFSIFINGFNRKQSRTLTPLFNDFFTRMLTI